MEENVNNTSSDAVSTSQKRSSGRGADWVAAVKLGELDSFISHFIHIWCCDSWVTAAIPVAVTHIISEKNYEIGFVFPPPDLPEIFLTLVSRDTYQAFRLLQIGFVLHNWVRAGRRTQPIWCTDGRRGRWFARSCTITLLFL